MTREDLVAAPLAAVGGAQGAYKYALKPFLAEHAAQLGWGLTLSVPGLYDAWALRTGHETLSHAFRQANQHPIYRYACVGALGGLAVHLLQKP